MPSCCCVVLTSMQELEATREAHQQQLQQVAATAQQQLSAEAANSSANLSRHLSLIDKLMEEKTQLARKLEDMQQAAVVSLLVRPCHAALCVCVFWGWRWTQPHQGFFVCCLSAWFWLPATDGSRAMLLLPAATGCRGASRCICGCSEAGLGC